VDRHRARRRRSARRVDDPGELVVAARGVCACTGTPGGSRSRWRCSLVAALLFGIGHSTGVVRSAGGIDGLWLHVAAALALVPLLLWHLAARWVRPRRSDASRRALLRAGGLAIAAARRLRAVEWPGCRAPAAGSPARYERGSFEPARMPNTIWLNDHRAAARRVGVRSAQCRRRRLHGAICRWPTCGTGTVTRRARARLHLRLVRRAGLERVCRVTDLLPSERAGAARSLLVRSHTGYWVAADRSATSSNLLLGHRGSAAARSRPGTRLPDAARRARRRGFWWVKWVSTGSSCRAHRRWWQPAVPADREARPRATPVTDSQINEVAASTRARSW
jgi:hypothetical protein